jgi:hypothetical protein
MYRSRDFRKDYGLLVGGYQFFGGSCYLYLQGTKLCYDVTQIHPSLLCY